MSQVKHHSSGIEYWRSLEQLAETPEVRDLVGKEFPGYDPDSVLNTSRRRFLKIMGASMALAGVTLTGCRRAPREYLAPYTSNPAGRTPGTPEYYATIYELGGIGAGLLVTSFDGRPIKVEGNPDHPFAYTGTVGNRKIGSADAFAQASVLELYDPERSRQVLHEGKPAKWSDFVAFAKTLKGKGDGVSVLCEAASGPAVTDMRARLSKALPGSKWYEYEAVSNDNELEGHKIAFGAPLRSVLKLDKASTVVLLDADLLGTHPAHTRYAADWASRRRTADNAANRSMNRVYVAESTFSVTGTVADHRLAIDPDRIHAVALAILGGLGEAAKLTKADILSPAETQFVNAAVKDLEHDGVVAAGPAASPQVHALAAAINAKIGAIGKTVVYLEDASFDRPAHAAAISALAKDIEGGKVTTLLILGGNPAYDAPADLGFDKLLAKAGTTIHLSLYENETSKLCKWHLPRAHYLESWGDARAYDGTPSVCQPLIEALYDGKSIIETLAAVSGDELADGHAIVQRAWASMLPKGEGDLEFRRVLELGLVKDAGYKVATTQAKSVDFGAVPAKGTGFYLRLEPDSRVYDGRFANNGWLQETPDPLSKLCWDNALMVAKKDADGLGVDTGSMVSVKVGSATVEAAVYIMPGQPEGVIGLSLGYGRSAAGHVGTGLGFNAYGLRDSKTGYVARNATVTKSGGTFTLAMTQNHHLIDNIGAETRDQRIGAKGESGPIIREASLAHYAKNPDFAKEESEGVRLQMFDQMKFETPHKWGMSVDLATCIGCNACAVACQAENNIPIVGKDQVLRHREMNWIRIDRYFKGDADPTTQVVHQPMMCQHCENAPCEQVCPVAATMHDSEGLNTMVYNRCIGTRYCSNNCPYKVRRYNYFDFHCKDPRGMANPWLDIPDTQDMERVDKIKRMVFNPEVTVRMRGVMEKCTYCVQRIHAATTKNRAEQMAKNGSSANAQVADGSVITACQQACPTQAIVFGNLNDKQSKVYASHIEKAKRAYEVLEDLNVRPRTVYLAKVNNPVAGAENEHGKETKATHG